MASGFGNSQDLVDIQNIRDGAVVLKDGSMRQILMVGGINFSLKSEEEQNMITTSYQNFLNSIDFPVQILIHSRKINIENYLEDLSKKMKAEESPILQNQISEYREFVRQFVSENAIMEKTFFVVISWYPLVFKAPSSAGFSLPFFKKKDPSAESKMEAEREEDFRKELSQLSQRSSQALQGLSSMGLEAIILNDEQLTELFYNFYNPGSIEKGSINLPK